MKSPRELIGTPLGRRATILLGLLPSMQKKFDHATSHSLRNGVFCGSFADDVSITSRMVASLV